MLRVDTDSGTQTRRFVFGAPQPPTGEPMMVEDPQYLAQPYVKTYQYKKQADASGWNPTPCSKK